MPLKTSAIRIPLALALIFAACFLVSANARAGESENVALVRSLYAAFGKGETAKVVDACSEDVRWEIVAPPSACSCFGVRTGKAAVAEFFKEIASSHDYKAFEPREYFPSGDVVTVVGSHDLIVKATGRRFKADWVHLFTITAGKIASFREFTDTAAYVEAAK